MQDLTVGEQRSLIDAIGSVTQSYTAVVYKDGAEVPSRTDVPFVPRDTDPKLSFPVSVAIRNPTAVLGSSNVSLLVYSPHVMLGMVVAREIGMCFLVPIDATYKNDLFELSITDLDGTQYGWVVSELFPDHSCRVELSIDNEKWVCDLIDVSQQRQEE